MKRVLTIVLAISIGLSMTACDMLDRVLQVNIFEPFSAVSEKDISSADAATLLALSGSESFYKTLASAPEKKAEVLVKLDAAIANPDTPTATRQELLVLAAQIELQTTPAGDLVNNIGGLINELMAKGSQPSGDGMDLGKLIESIIPKSVASNGTVNRDAFIAMINGLDGANDYFMALGNSIPGGAYDNSANVSAGDVAQGAVVAAIIAGIEPPVGYDSTGGYLYDLLKDPDNTPPPAKEFAMPDFKTGYLNNLLRAAKLDTLFSGEAVQ